MVISDDKLVKKNHRYIVYKLQYPEFFLMIFNSNKCHFIFKYRYILYSEHVELLILLIISNSEISMIS